MVTLYYRPPELLLGSRVYSTPLDMWSVGCIFGEMLTGEYLFKGNGEIDQINQIFRALGMPTEDQWPGFSALPNVSKISWKAPSRGKLREMFSSTSFSGGVFLNDTGYDLLSKILHMDPNQVRIHLCVMYMYAYLIRMYVLYLCMQVLYVCLCYIYILHVREWAYMYVFTFL